MYDSLIATALKSQANIGKSFQSFFIETMELFLTHTGRLNFTRMARCGRSCESRFRQNFKKPFDWFSFNRTFLEQTMGHRIAIAKAFASQQRMDLSVGSTKTLLHKSAMVERFISMSGKHADMRFNNTDFKELLFYGIRAAV